MKPLTTDFSGGRCSPVPTSHLYIRSTEDDFRRILQAFLQPLHNGRPTHDESRSARLVVRLSIEAIEVDILRRAILVFIPSKQGADSLGLRMLVARNDGACRSCFRGTTQNSTADELNQQVSRGLVGEPVVEPLQSWKILRNEQELIGGIL